MRTDTLLPIDRAADPRIISFTVFHTRRWRRRWQHAALQQIEHLQQHDPLANTLVEVGCGDGAFTIQVAQHFPHLQPVWGITADGMHTAAARRQLQQQHHHIAQRMEFHAGAPTLLPLADNEFRIVLCLDALLTLPGLVLEEAAAELTRVCARWLVLTLPGRGPQAERLLRQFRDAGFSPWFRPPRGWRNLFLPGRLVVLRHG